MKKIIAAFFLVIIITLIVGCKAPKKEEPKLEVEVAEEDIASDVSDIDTLEEDLNTSELDELDTLINNLG